MRIALVGGTGFVGSAVLDELLLRGHDVTALTRRPDNPAPRPRLEISKADALDASQVARAVKGVDAVVSAYNPGWTHPDLYATFMKGAAAIVDGVKRAGVRRLLVVGGAGSLFVAPGVQLVDTPAFLDNVPPNVVPGARAARDELTRLRNETTLDWTFLSPPVGLAPGERRGSYRLGAEEVLMDGDKPAGISVADLAVAIVDEIEKPQHIRKRFTVAS